ncbi:hypothetical protein [Vibrio fluvialis]|uniref:hypothetical protein n=1 Tax=Vibrio fluvialis TaxID=676 RepID=UPI001E4345CC|nr:hypothetical protein [Vibrio fluvialis]
MDRQYGLGVHDPERLSRHDYFAVFYDLAAKLWNVPVARNAFLLMLIVPQFVLQAKTAQI